MCMLPLLVVPLSRPGGHELVPGVCNGADGDADDLYNGAQYENYQLNAFVGHPEFHVSEISRVAAANPDSIVGRLFNEASNRSDLMPILQTTEWNEKWKQFFMARLTTLVSEWNLPADARDVQCAVHVRAGDVIECDDHTVEEMLSKEAPCTPDVFAEGNCTSSGHVYVRPLQYFTEQFSQPGVECDVVTLFAGSQFLNSSIRHGTEHSCAGREKSMRYLRAVRSHLCSLGFRTVTMRLGQPPDDDFAALCRSKTFVGSGGGFDELVGLIRNQSKPTHAVVSD